MTFRTVRSVIDTNLAMQQCKIITHKSHSMHEVTLFCTENSERFYHVFKGFFKFFSPTFLHRLT